MNFAKTAIAPAAAVNNRIVELALAHKQDQAISLLIKEGVPLLKKFRMPSKSI